MLQPSTVDEQIKEIIMKLVYLGIAEDQKFSFVRERGSNIFEVTFEGAEHVSIALRDRFYTEIYNQLAQERAYNIKTMDGAMIQMMYRFIHDVLESHRLAFFPSPYLEIFQNNSSLYYEDEIYADIIAKNIVPFPIRFDYDAREDIFKELEHPKSHLTLGQYEKCRIPVSSPLTPGHFMHFILRNFYNTAYERYSETLPNFKDKFEDSIFSSERNIVHIQVP